MPLVALLASAWLAACAGLQPAARPTVPAPAASLGNEAIPGVNAARLDPDYWIARLANPSGVVLEPAEITAQNARLLAEDANVFDLAALPSSMDAAQVLLRVRNVSPAAGRSLYDIHGNELTPAHWEALQDALALDTIASPVNPRFGLVTRRSDLRSFPTAERVFSRRGDTNIDRFQETALFPGSAVAVLHESRDQHWSLVISHTYIAWMRSANIALGERDEVLDYTRRAPYLVVTGAQARTVFTPEAPALSDLVLDMGVRLPLLADWPESRLVNGQLPYASHVVALPSRDADGRLEIVPALVPRSADVGTGYLPLTRENLIRQAFKFLGERYGWGHSYGTRDCSGFVSEIYRSFGVEMPRNTSAQAVSPAFARIHFEPGEGHERRMAVLRTLDVGDLIYIPGHVMMVIGHEDGETWLIHDTTGTRYRNAAGELVSVSLNQVAVTPLYALLGDSGTPYVDFITNIQRIRLVDPE